MAEANSLDPRAAALPAAPDLDYYPPSPKRYRPVLGLIGCGVITEHHLRAYRAAGWEVGAFFDLNRAAAEKRRTEFFPEARVCDSVEELLATPRLEVVDIATHPAARVPLIEQAIAAGRHVLSQKPFVLDLEEGRRLVQLAKGAGVKLAVNQNGRWAPYFAYMRKAVQAGLVGRVSSVAMALNWDHTWTKGTAFEEIHHLILYDFAIHWFDAVSSFFGGEPAKSVQSALRYAPDQPVKPPLIASSLVSYEKGIATLAFDGWSRFAPRETCTIVGTDGTLHGTGGICSISAVDLTNANGPTRAELKGSWFPDGFRGTMGELLCAIEEDRDPENSAADNLQSLAVCFAAISAASGGAV